MCQLLARLSGNIRFWHTHKEIHTLAFTLAVKIDILVLDQGASQASIDMIVAYSDKFTVDVVW